MNRKDRKAKDVKSKNQKLKSAGQDAPHKLRDSDIVTTPFIGRRTFLTLLGSFTSGAVTATLGATPASARSDSDSNDVSQSDAKDSDTGRFADPHLPGDRNDGGWDNPDNDMRVFADRKDRD